MTKNDKAKVDAILRVIAQDDDLVEQFANAIGETVEDFDQWLDTVKLN